MKTKQPKNSIRIVNDDGLAIGSTSLLCREDECRIEGFATALQAVEKFMLGEDRCGKSYDPMTISDGVMHSYAFDMMDGGRHHPISDYITKKHIESVLLNETMELLQEKGVTF